MFSFKAKKCGYHLTPSAFFREHPERKPGPDWRYETVDVEALRRAGRVNWVHSVLKRRDLTPPRGLQPEGWELRQCLFGEHLLREYPDKTVALVESEKTAVICAGLMPSHLWLATGGKQGINERLLVLQGRRVVAYPDIDGYEEWTRKLSEFPSLGVTVSPLLQQNASAEDVAAHIDIADWLLRYRASGGGSGVPRHSATFLKVKDRVSPECHEELEKLIEELGLVYLGV